MAVGRYANPARGQAYEATSDINIERWVPAKGLEGYFEVSNNGDVRTVPREYKYGIHGISKRITQHLMKPRKNRGGYMYLNLNADGKRITITVHRITLNSFVENPEGLPYINHKNGIKTDNRVENLEWISPKGNVAHAFSLGLRKRGFTMTKRRSFCKLNDDQVAEIRNSVEINRILAARFNVSMTTISYTKRGICYKKLKTDGE